MKILKWIGIVLLVLFLLFVLINVFAPKKLEVTRSIEMDAPANMIYNVINDFKNEPKWSPWIQQDPSMQVTLSDNTSGVGATSTWTSETMGDGRQEIVESAKARSIKTKLNFEGFDGDNYANWTFEPNGDKTKVSWGMNGAENPFFTRFFNILMKGSIQDNYDEGLASLKQMVEARATSKTYNGYKINEVELPEQYFLAQRQEVKMANIEQFYARVLPSLSRKAAEAGIELAGMPCGLMYKWDEQMGTTDLAGAMPITEPTNINGASTITIPAKKAIQIDYYGKYENSTEGHAAIDAYINDFELLYDWPVIEQYITDPGQEPDESKWLTKITYFLAE